MSIADELTSRQKHDEAFVAHYRLAQAPRADYLQNYLDCRASVSRLLDTGPNRSSAARAVEGMLLLLILANVAAVTVCTGVDRSSDELYRYYHEFELVSTAIFVVEYLARFWVAAEDEQFYGFGALCGRLRWAVKPINVLDAIALIPFVVDLLTPDSESYAAATTIRLVRLLRLFSLLRLERGFQSLARIKSVVDKTGEELLITVFVASIILVISSSLVYFVESEHNEQFSNMGTAMWWGVATLTTVGYGDIAPITPIGRLLGAFTAFIGVGSAVLGHRTRRRNAASWLLIAHECGRMAAHRSRFGLSDGSLTDRHTFDPRTGSCSLRAASGHNWIRACRGDDGREALRRA